METQHPHDFVEQSYEEALLLLLIPPHGSGSQGCQWDEFYLKDKMLEFNLSAVNGREK